MVFLSQVEVCFGRVLRPLVTVEGESTSDLFMFQSLADGVRYQGRRHIGADLPCQNNLTAQVQYRTHIQHAAGNRNVGDICHPELIWFRLVKAAIQQIGLLVNSLLVTGVGPTAANNRQQA